MIQVINAPVILRGKKFKAAQPIITAHQKGILRIVNRVHVAETIEEKVAIDAQIPEIENQQTIATIMVTIAEKNIAVAQAIAAIMIIPLVIIENLLIKMKTIIVTKSVVHLEEDNLMQINQRMTKVNVEIVVLAAQVVEVAAQLQANHLVKKEDKLKIERDLLRRAMIKIEVLIMTIKSKVILQELAKTAAITKIKKAQKVLETEPLQMLVSRSTQVDKEI